MCNRGIYSRFDAPWGLRSYEEPTGNRQNDGSPLGSSLIDRPDFLKPRCAPTLRGNSGGCPLPTDFEHVYQAYGATPTTYARMPGDTKPTRPSVAESSSPLVTDPTVMYGISNDAANGFSVGDTYTFTGFTNDIDLLYGVLELNREFEMTVTSPTTFTFDIPSLGQGGVSLGSSPDFPGLAVAIPVGQVYTVEVTSDTPHGLTTGDRRALIGSPNQLAKVLASSLNAVHTVTAILNPFVWIFEVNNTPVISVSSDVVQFTDRTEWRDIWLEQAIESVIDGDNFQETDTIATTVGSSVLTVTTSTPHGLAVANEITITNVATPIEGIPIDDINKQHSVTTIVSPTVFEVTVATPATGTNAGTGGEFFVRHRTGAKKKRSQLRSVPRSIHHPAVKHNVPRSSGMEHYGKDITCTPEMGTLTPIANMTKTYMIHYNNPPTNVGMSTNNTKEDNMDEVIEKAEGMIMTEIMNGGLCMDAEHGLMGTSKCKFLPFIVFENSKVAQVMPENAYDPDNRNSAGQDEEAQAPEEQEEPTWKALLATNATNATLPISR